MQLCNLCFIFVSLHIVCQLVCGQNLFDVRYTATGIQIYAQDGATIDWFYIRNKGVGFPEGSVLCNNLTNNPFVRYYKNDENDMRMAKLNCDLGDDSVSQCAIQFENTKNDQVNVICLSREGWNEGDVRQLPDGRILYLVRPTGSPLLVWAHFCYKQNNWNGYIANLLCRELGYQNVKSGSEQLKFNDNLKVFGLKNFNCESPAPYNNCTVEQNSGNGKCEDDEVILIECENRITTSTSDHITTTIPNDNLTVVSNTTLPSTTPGLNNTTHSISATTPNNVGTTMNTIINTTNYTSTTMNNNTTANNIANTLNNITTTLPISTTRVITTPSSNSSQMNNNNINGNAIIWALATLGILLALMVVVAVVLIIIGIIVRRKRSKRESSSHNPLNNLGLNRIHNAVSRVSDANYANVDFRRELLTREPSEYLNPVENPGIGESFTFRNNNTIEQDEIIYEGVLAGHNQFVKSVEEREYYTSMESCATNTTYVPELNKCSYSTALMCEDEYWEPGVTIEGIYAQMSQYRFNEIERSELVENNKLGEGNFGLVMSGYWKTNGQSIPVALKTLKIEDETSNIEFLQEAAILGQFHHANVLKLLGVVTLSKPLLMVTEQMKTGLKNFLKTIKQSGTPNFDLFSILFLRLTNDIANGMQHLASKKFVHRDLAARNILLSHTLTCKISDFGLARHAIENDEYYMSSGGKIPLKWTSPEAIFYKKYSEKSDVWSYGVTIYEVWTVGAVPWEGVSPDDLIESLSQGVILPPPSGCPRRVYKLMVDCWNPDHHARPSFSQIVETLQREEGMFLNRGNDPLERMEFSLPPSRTERLFKDLQNRYINL